MISEMTGAEIEERVRETRNAYRKKKIPFEELKAVMDERWRKVG